MRSSGDVTTRKLVDKHIRKQQRVQAENKRLRGIIKAQHDGHLGQLQNARMAILSTGDELQDVLNAQADEIEGFKAAREHLKRGLLSRLWFALRLAWRGRFA